MYTSDLKHSCPRLQQKLEQIYKMRADSPVKMGFREPYINLLKVLGNPHENLPPVIHVAGTNGKGSVVATLKSCLQQSGYSVHTYTSPHLVEFNERIVLAGEKIGNEYLESLIDEAMALSKGQALSFFEFTSAIAFKAFAEQKADFLLLEVGMGGCLDCTNIIPDPEITVITPVSLDHTEFLGDSIDKIAAEKAGIIKSGIPCVIGPQHPEALTVLKATARKAKAPVSIYGEDWKIKTVEEGIKLTSAGKEKIYAAPSLYGKHQIANAGIALQTLSLLDKIKNENAINQGLKNIDWPARMQKITELGTEQCEIWLDGGHNPDAARALSENIRKWSDESPVYLIVGIMAKKDIVHFLEPVLPIISGIVATTISGEEKALPAKDLEAQIIKLSPDKNLGAEPDFLKALDKIKNTAGKNGPYRILICGSLYLAGEVLQHVKAEAILIKRLSHTG